MLTEDLVAQGLNQRLGFLIGPEKICLLIYEI